MYRHIFIRLGILWIFLLCLLLASRSEADIIELDELTANYGKFMSPNRSAYFPQEQKDRISLEQKSSVLTYGFFNTQVHGTSDDGQYRQVGLQFELGARLGDKVDLFYQHHSQHLLDTKDYYGRNFFVEDSVNLRLYLYRRK